MSLRTVAEFTESIQDVSEVIVHGRQQRQLDLLEVFRTVVFQVTVSFTDAADNRRRLEKDRCFYQLNVAEEETMARMDGASVTSKSAGSYHDLMHLWLSRFNLTVET